MGSSVNILKELEKSVEKGDIEAAREAAKKALEAGVDPLEAIEQGAAKGVRRVGERFDRREAFLPELVMAGDAMTEVVKILETVMTKEQVKAAKQGTIVIGTVQGDVHDIGKNIVSSLLTAAGFEVHDIGKDISADQFVEKALESDADIIGASALMTVTMPAQKELLDELKRKGLRDKFKVIVGGGSVYQEWADEIGADGYARNAQEAVKLCEKLLH